MYDLKVFILFSGKDAKFRHSLSASIIGMNLSFGHSFRVIACSGWVLLMRSIKIGGRFPAVGEVLG